MMASSTQLRDETGAGGISLRAVLTLMALSVFINYIDRADFSIIAPFLKDELHISAAELGFLLSAFFWTYAAATLLSGWLIDRFEVSWVLAAGFFLWSAATAATGLIHGFAGLFAVRLILGIGASVALPAYSKIIARNIPPARRGAANACIAAGVFLGPAAVTSAGGLLFARFGWRSCFVVLGLLSLLWLIPWRSVMPEGEGAEPASAGPVPATSQILRQRSAWGTFFGLFCGQYYFYFLITWLPYYLIRRRGFTTERMAFTAGGAFLGMAITE
jgi:ACS family D-galactonate transporter-like MFS transporter